MIMRSSAQHKLLLAVTLTAFLVALPAFAQQTKDQPSGQSAAPPQGAKPLPILQPQPTTVPGRPDIPDAEVAAKLRFISFAAISSTAGQTADRATQVAQGLQDRRLCQRDRKCALAAAR